MDPPFLLRNETAVRATRGRRRMGCHECVQSDAEDLARVADQILEVDLRSLGWPEPPKALRREVRVASLSEEVQFEGQYQTHEILRPGNAEG